MDSSLQGVVKDILRSDFKDANAVASVAVTALSKRRKALLKEKKKCKELHGFENRRVCYGKVQDLEDSIKEEGKMLFRLRRCDAKYSDDTAKMIECVQDLREQLMGLLSHSSLTESVGSINQAVEAVEDNDRVADDDVEGAISMVRKRLKAIISRKILCKALTQAGPRQKCLLAVKKLVQRNEHERDLLAKLEKCSEIYAFEDEERRHCASVIGRKILLLINNRRQYLRMKRERLTKQKMAKESSVSFHTWKPETDSPDSLRRLNIMERKDRLRLRDKISVLREQLRNCESLKCRKSALEAIRTARRFLKAVHDRYEPRRKCLIRRRKFRDREFTLRAHEHSTYSKLHELAWRCKNQDCLDRIDKAEHKLDAKLKERRDRRREEWKNIRCMVVLPFSAVAPEESYDELASLNFSLHHLYKQLKKCSSSECRTETRVEINRVEKLVKHMSRHLSRVSFQRRVAQHKRQARFDRAFARLYRKSLTCGDRSCRRMYQEKLEHLQDLRDHEKISNGFVKT